MQGLRISFFNHKITNYLPCKKINKMNVSLLSGSWFLILYGAKLTSFSYTSMKIWDMSLAFLKEIIKSWLSLFFNWTSFSLADSSSPKRSGECVALELFLKGMLSKSYCDSVRGLGFPAMFSALSPFLSMSPSKLTLLGAYQGKKSWCSAACKW